MLDVESTPPEDLTQSFRLLGTMRIEDIPCDSVNGQYIIYWDDIEQVFPDVRHIRNGKVVVSFLRDPNRNR